MDANFRSFWSKDKRAHDGHQALPLQCASQPKQSVDADHPARLAQTGGELGGKMADDGLGNIHEHLLLLAVRTAAIHVASFFLICFLRNLFFHF